MDLEQLVLDYVARAGYRPVKPRQIAEQLDLSDDRRDEVRRTIKKLVKRGRLAWGPGHLVLRPGDNPDEVFGTFRRTEKGFGFVRPRDTPAGEGRDHDVYIPADDALDASSGDLVRVKIKTTAVGPRDNQRAGKIVEIVERDTHQFVGTYFESAGRAYVTVDGTIFAQPIAVGDPGAKQASPDDKVVVEIVRFPSHTHGGEGVITEVLGPLGQPGVDTLSIIREYNLPEEFPEDTLDEARRQAEAFDEQIHAPREDFTGLTVLTIDPVDARDFDDAISLERIERDHWRLGVHIADVAHFVPAGTALDREAFNRATSVYLPDRVLPMLPEIISNSLASLQPDRVRYTKTVFIEFTPDGARVASDVHSGAIRSRRRFAYEEIDDYLSRPDHWQTELTPEVHDLVGRMHELAMILRRRRFARGALELSMNETKVALDREGKVAGAYLVQNTESHQIIEEFMLAANEAVADTIREAGVLFLRRIHENPDPRKLADLTRFVSELGLAVPSLESRFELQALLNRVVGRPEAHAVNYALLRSLQRAVYSPREEGHYALASECYCHFTSPIRRYPDLTVHRILDQLLRHKKPPSDMQHLVRLGVHCSEREQRAEEAERELTKLKLLSYMAQRIGQELDAVVTGVEPFGLFACGLEIPAEGLIHISSLGDDYYRYDKQSHSLSGYQAGNAFRLGDVIRVAVAHVDLERRQLDFRVVGRGQPSERPRRGRDEATARRPSSPATRSAPPGRKKPGPGPGGRRGKRR